MIDYEKLKQAHELMQAHKKCYCELEFGWSDHILIKLYDDTGPVELDNECILYTESMEDLITKLIELTKPEPKYKVGDELYTASCDVIFYTVVKSIDYDNQQGFIYITSNRAATISECCLYPSKQELIEAKLDYWAKLKNEEISTRSDDESIPSICSHLFANGACITCGYVQHIIKLPTGTAGQVFDPQKYAWVDATQQQKCQHEHDGTIANVNQRGSRVELEFKCIKCGEVF